MGQNKKGALISKRPRPLARNVCFLVFALCVAEAVVREYHWMITGDEHEVRRGIQSVGSKLP